jgi:sulfite reductase (NADPH) flavoprotein alpha-component
VPTVVAPVPAAAAPAASPPVGGRSGAAPAPLARSAPLNGTGSAKDTRHIVFRLDGTGLDYQVGDSLGVHAVNCPDLVTAVIECLGASPDLEVDCPDGSRRRLGEALAQVCDVGRPSDEAIEVLASRAHVADEADILQAMAEGYPGSGPEEADLLDLLLAFPSARPPVQELISALGVLQPRLYSIASSSKATPGEVHLTVAAVRYRRRDRLRKGVASIFLAERAAPGATVPVFVQPAHGFRLPEKNDVPIIMIGPGTGIAPFRAFLQERRALGATGRNWLFFGDQHGGTDFLYRDDMAAFARDGLLTRLDTAFSRDQADKIYVQHRMRQHAAELWAWLQDGARVYVCGDATRMARDVDTALTHIIAKQGGMEMAGAKAYLAQMGREQRYLRDVY